MYLDSRMRELSAVIHAHNEELTTVYEDLYYCNNIGNSVWSWEWGVREIPAPMILYLKMIIIKNETKLLNECTSHEISVA